MDTRFKNIRKTNLTLFANNQFGGKKTNNSRPMLPAKDHPPQLWRYKKFMCHKRIFHDPLDLFSLQCPRLLTKVTPGWIGHPEISLLSALTEPFIMANNPRIWIFEVKWSSSSTQLENTLSITQVGCTIFSFVTEALDVLSNLAHAYHGLSSCEQLSS